MSPQENTVDKKEKPWWLSGEVLLTLLVAAFFRLVFINTTQFMADHAAFYQMAYDGVALGLWPISGNHASVGPLIPPLFVYLLMIPAAISSNPLAGAIFIALSNIGAVLLTYLFVRRYYGRLPATIAALLYATATNVLIFSRDIWQPDLLPPLVLLFMFCLFRGVVEQRRNWFLPAAILLGAMFQIHTSAIYLIIPFLAAVILAFKTLRVRDIILAAIAELLLFSPYLLLEITDHFADIQALLNAFMQPSHITPESLQFYGTFVKSTVDRVPANSSQYVDTHLFPANSHSIMMTPLLYPLQLFLQKESFLMPYVLFASMFAVLFLMVFPGNLSNSTGNRRTLLKEFLASPYRKGLLLLMTWQSLVFVMLRHPSALFIHYLLFLVPGPFILIAIASTSLLQLVRRFWPAAGATLLRYGVLCSCGLMILAQTIGSASTLIDRAQGNFDSKYSFPEYFDLASQQQILAEADQLAREHHISRIYAATDYAIYMSFPYLARFEQTPITTFNDGQCLMLPASEIGPVVFIAPPGDPQIGAILRHYANILLTQEVPHPGGAPFQLYILTAKSEPTARQALTTGWQVLSPGTRLLSSATTNQQWLTTRWHIPTTQKPAPRTLYDFHLQLQPGSNSAGQVGLDCPATATWAGDQIFSMYQVDARMPVPQSITLQASTHSTIPMQYHMGPLTVVTYDKKDTPLVPIQPIDGQKQIVISVVPDR